MNSLDKNAVEILREIAKEVYFAVNPLIGTDKARKVVGSGFGGDATVFIDEVAEQAIIRYLERERLDCTFIGEERGVQKIGRKPSSWFLIADAVDGTTNAVRGIKFAAASLALSSEDRLGSLEAAVVINLCDGDIFEAEKGKGARYNGGAAKPSRTTRLEDAVLSIDVSRAPHSVEKVVCLMKTVKSVRSLGSAALEVCYVASGLLDAYVDLRGKLRTLDIAAAMLILKEAGGILLQPNGEDLNGFPMTELNRVSVIGAANNAIYEELTALLPC